MSDRSNRSGRTKASLGDMTIWVLSAAIFFAMMRRATGFWGKPIPVLNTDRAAGALLLAIATCVTTRLIMDASRRGQGRAKVFGTVWRILAVVCVLGLAISEAVVLQKEDRSFGVFTPFREATWQANLAAIGLAIGLIGVFLGTVPTKASRRNLKKRHRGGAASTVFAAVAGLLILATFDMAIPYMVLIAIEAVRIALQRPGMMYEHIWIGHTIDPSVFDPSLWRSIHERLMTAGAAAGMGMAACMLTGDWLGRDLRRGETESQTNRTWVDLTYRALTAAVTWGLGLYLTFVSLPALHPWLAEGIWAILDPWGTIVIATSFIALAAGLAARGVAEPIEFAPSVDEPTRSWLSTVDLLIMAVKLIAAPLLVALILAAVSEIRGDEIRPWYVPIPLSDLLLKANTLLTLKTSGAIYFDPGKAPEVFILLAGVVGIVATVPRFLFGGCTAPIDRIGHNPRLIGPFLGSWLAIVGVIFTLFPTLVLGGLVLIHLGLKANLH